MKVAKKKTKKSNDLICIYFAYEFYKWGSWGTSSNWQIELNIDATWYSTTYMVCRESTVVKFKNNHAGLRGPYCTMMYSQLSQNSTLFFNYLEFYSPYLAGNTSQIIDSRLSIRRAMAQ